MTIAIAVLQIVAAMLLVTATIVSSQFPGRRKLMIANVLASLLFLGLAALQVQIHILNADTARPNADTARLCAETDQMQRLEKP